MKNNRIAFVYPWPNLDTVPSLCAFIKLLAAHSFHVDIFIPNTDQYEFPQFDESRVQIIAFGSQTVAATKRLVYSKHLFLIRKMLWPFKDFIEPFLFQNEKPSLSALLQRHEDIPYKCIIGIDPEGIAAVGSVADTLRVPLVYWSLELLISKDLSNKKWHKLKEKERLYSRKATVIVIQDEDRAKLMASDNCLPINKFMFVPNAPIGPAKRQPSVFWHQRFSLSKDKKIVLNSGSLGDWTGIRDIVSSATNWPREWVLVVHTRCHSFQDCEIERLRRMGEPNRVFLSTKAIPRMKYSELVSGANIGIAFYLPIPGLPYNQDNTRIIGLSSGKIACYLKEGLPVIVNRWPSISHIIEREKCGIVVDNARGIPEALSAIAQYNEEFSRNACRVFEKYLEPSNKIKQVISRIEQFGESKHGAR